MSPFVFLFICVSVGLCFNRGFDPHLKPSTLLLLFPNIGHHITDNMDCHPEERKTKGWSVNVALELLHHASRDVEALLMKTGFKSTVQICFYSWWSLMDSCVRPSLAVRHTHTHRVGESVCGSEVSSLVALPFFFCFVCKHREGPRHRQAADCCRGLSLPYKRHQQDRKEGIALMFGLCRLLLPFSFPCKCVMWRSGCG